MHFCVCIDNVTHSLPLNNGTNKSPLNKTYISYREPKNNYVFLLLIKLASGCTGKAFPGQAMRVQEVVAPRFH